MFIFFLVSLVGHALVHRRFLSMAREFSLSHQLIRTISLINFCVIIVFSIIIAPAHSTLWLFIGILLITLKFFPHIFRFFLIARLRSALIPFLDCVILNLQAGKSFRFSLQLSIEMQSGWVRHQLAEVCESLHMSKNVIALKSNLLKGFRDELVEIDQSQVRCVEQVRALRRSLKMQEDFRRRSGQVTQQIKMQAIIVTVLFVLLLVFVIMQFGFTPHRLWIFLSSFVFFVGLVWIFFMGRRIKWTV